MTTFEVKNGNETLEIMKMPIGLIVSASFFMLAGVEDNQPRSWCLFRGCGRDYGSCCLYIFDCLFLSLLKEYFEALTGCTCPMFTCRLQNFCFTDMHNFGLLKCHQDHSSTLALTP